MKQSKTVESPAHWSKDFVEHLRTVHFGLIAISAGLIILVASSKPYKPSVAVRQLEEIIELQTLWKDREWVHYTASSSDSRDSIVVEDNCRDFELPFLGIEHDGLTVYSVPSKARPKPHLPDRLSLPGDWIGETKFDDYTQMAESLSSFESWWNGLQHEGATIIEPEAVASYGHIRVRNGLHFENETIDPSSVNAVRRATTRGQPSTFLVSTTEQKVSTAKSLKFYLHRNDDPFRGNRRKDTFEFSAIFNDSQISIPICMLYKSVVSQASLSKVYKDWRQGPYSESFYDLDQMTKDLKDLKFERISKLVSPEAGKGSEVFEAFGMKFPTDQITVWGLLILISVQVYFFVYLRQFSGKLKMDDPGWDVPWIAMEQSILSKSIVFVSFFLIPPVAILFLSRQAVLSLSGGMPSKGVLWFLRLTYILLKSNAWSFSKIFCLFSILGLSVLLGFLCWKYRPKLVPEEPLATKPQDVLVD